jgi:hypothetical protein
MRTIDQVLSAHTSEWMSVPGVIGSGQGERGGKPLVVIYVVRATPEIAARLPKSVEGYDVEIRESGTVRALGDSAR